MSGFILFSRDEGDLLIFKSRQALLGYVEPQEILDQLYDVFDGKGNLYEIGLNDQHRPELSTFHSYNPEHLASKLRSYLAAMRPHLREVLNHLTLSDLIEHLSEWQTESGRLRWVK